MFRQGDVLVVPMPREELPNGLVQAPRDKNNRMVVAQGEATGHALVLTGERASLLCAPDDPDRLFMLIEGYGRLGHEEHGPIALAPGAYRVIRQREYFPGAIRPVSD